MAEVTTMVLKVDLGCSKCYKKVKKALCKFPQIRDQVYDEKQNKVTIKVAGRCPEEMMQKIRCKGGKSILSIEIIPPPKNQKPDDNGKSDKGSGEKEGKKKTSDGKETKENGATSDGKKGRPSIETVECEVLIKCRECSERPGVGPCGRHPCHCIPPTPCHDRPPCIGIPPPPPPCFHVPPPPPFNCGSCGGGGCYRCYHRNRTEYYWDENPSPCRIL